MFTVGNVNTPPTDCRQESSSIDMQPRVSSPMRPCELLSSTVPHHTLPVYASCLSSDSNVNCCHSLPPRSLPNYNSLPNSFLCYPDVSKADMTEIHSVQSPHIITLEIVSELIDDLEGFSASTHSSATRSWSSPVSQLSVVPRKRTIDQALDYDSRDVSSINDLDSILSFDVDVFESSPQEEAVECDLTSEPCPLHVCSSISHPVLSTEHDERRLDTQGVKRRRIEATNSDSAKDRFHGYQNDQWLSRYEELSKYCSEVGHCNVPSVYEENPTLARWVKRQRYQYKLMNEGKSSTMTNGRAIALEGLGFIWDSQSVQWTERLNELKDFRRIYGHCNVPSRYLPNPKLSVWVKIQRRQYKLLCTGSKSNMTMERIAELEKIDFAWQIRRSV